MSHTPNEDRTPLYAKPSSTEIVYAQAFRQNGHVPVTSSASKAFDWSAPLVQANPHLKITFAFKLPSGQLPLFNEDQMWEILEETKEQFSARFGPISKIRGDRDGIYIRFETTESAEMAYKCTQGRLFDGYMLMADFVSYMMFNALVSGLRYPQKPRP